MNKLITLFSLVIMVLFFSCETSTKPKEVVKLKIENYIESIQKKFIGYETNSVINDELNSYLKKNIKNEIKNGLLNDLPFKLDKVEKCRNKYIAVLEHSLNSKYYDRGILNDIELDLYAETDEKTAKSLIEGTFYLTEVNFKEYITFQNNQNYCALVLMSPFMGYFDNEIQFGAIGVKLNKIEKVIK